MDIKTILEEFKKMREVNGLKTIWKEKYDRFGINIDEWLQSQLENLAKKEGNQIGTVAWCKNCNRGRYIIKGLCPGCLEKGSIVFETKTKFVDIKKKDICGNLKVKIDLRKLKGSSKVGYLGTTGTDMEDHDY